LQIYNNRKGLLYYLSQDCFPFSSGW
jgi:hypothetical protein